MAQKREKFRTYEGVFDESTLRTLFKLSSQGYFDELESPISLGKESNVYTASTKDDDLVIIKIYRVNTADFHKMYSYLKADPKYANLTRQKRKIIYTWARREFRNLLKARQAGVAVPTPYAVLNNVLIMEMIGDERPAPKVKIEPPKNIKKFSETLITFMTNLYQKANLIHGDLSEYNMLNYKDKPILIDLSHGTTKSNPNARELLTRDIKNITNYLIKQKYKISEEEILIKIKNGI